MANNLIVTYDLHTPGQNYQRIVKAVKALGDCAQIHQSVWYAKSAQNAEQAVDSLRKAADANDSIFVVDATNNVGAWSKLKKNSEAEIKRRWNAG